MYDPQIAVDHYLARRFDEDQRDAFNPLALQNAAYNEAIVRLEYLSLPERAAFLCWAVLIGTRASPGLVQLLRFAPRERGLAAARFAAALRGRLMASKDSVRGVKRSLRLSR